MRIDPAGWPFILGGLTVTLLSWLTGGPVFAAIFGVLTLFFLFFFRDPDRHHDAPDSAVISPADGRVMVAGDPTGTPPEGMARQISIFLSPMDVHVNRMPVNGRVTEVKYHPGKFLPAYRAEAGDLNEYTEVTIDHDGQPVVIRQIVGILARRIVCRAQEGDVVRAGGRFGVMKFGSRMDIFLPAGSTIHTQVGAKVVGGVTMIGTLPPHGAGVRRGAPGLPPRP
jgi:phosphatidylserine decarboxylase